MEWYNKSFILPDSLIDIRGKEVDGAVDYKIVSCYDSEGCTGCKMNLVAWNHFMNEIDSITHNGKVILIIYANSSNIEELKYYEKQSKFKHFMIADSLNQICDKNNISNVEEYRTFLLDKNNRVVALGNPIRNKKISELFKRIIVEGHKEKYDENPFIFSR